MSFGESISEQGALCIRELCGLTSLRLRKCTHLPDAALACMLQGACTGRRARPPPSQRPRPRNGCAALRVVGVRTAVVC